MDKDGDEAKAHLQQVPTSLPRRKKETFSKLSASTIGKKAIMPLGILKIGDKSQETNDDLSDLHTSDCS